MFDAKRVDPMLGPVTAAVSLPGGLHLRLFGVPFVAGAAEDLKVLRIMVEGTIGGIDRAAVVIEDNTALAAVRVPTAGARI